MQQTPHQKELDDDSRQKTSAAVPLIPVWAMFFLAALAALALIYVMGLLASTG